MRIASGWLGMPRLHLKPPGHTSLPAALRRTWSAWTRLLAPCADVKWTPAKASASASDRPRQHRLLEDTPIVFAGDGTNACIGDALALPRLDDAAQVDIVRQRGIVAEVVLVGAEGHVV